jgi:hypothetical protein
MCSYSIEERLIVSVWVHERQRAGETVNQVMTVFQQQFGKPSVHKAMSQVCSYFSDDL